MRTIRPNTFDIEDPNEKRWVEDLYKFINGNVSFGTSVNKGPNTNTNSDGNVQGTMVEIADSGLAGASITITHNLGYVPKFYDVKYISVATQIYDFGTPWTKVNIYLASTTAHVKLRVFVH